ncbi:MAG: Peptidase inactive domain protein [Verrucomicrobiales bacterium]|nr:Peptidase inactive domain protein [Verrucomicrobiales bacterium]
MTNQQRIEEIPAIPVGVKLTTLENGLTIITREDPSAPVVSAQAWCKTGSIDESKWMGAGLSHVLEHMLFKGTTTRPGARIDQEVQEAGGYMNAYTSFDRTVYWINVPSSGAQTAIDILCDIMQNASLPADDLAKELDVIRREMDMNEDDPGRRAGRRLFEVAYTRSPYRFTIIGYPQIFNQLQPADITGYYRERYAPNNMFYVVVGDITHDQVVAQITKCFEANKARPMAPMVLPQEPRQMAAREIIEEASIELGHFHFSWHIPDLRHVDIPALDVLATLLGAGRSARLFQEVREKKGLVVSVDAWTYSPGPAGLFGMSANSEAEKFEAAREAMLAEIERVKNELIPAGELAKVVKQFIAGTLSSRKTMQGQAQDLGGSWIAADDLNFSERYLAAVKRVTSSDLQRVARTYLATESRTHYALLPKGATPKKQFAIETSKKNPVQKFELPNGIRLLVKEDHRLPFVEYRAVFRGGILAENKENNGLTQLMSKMLLQGTSKRNAEQIALEIESVGGSIDSFGGNNSFGVNAETMSSDFETGLNLMVDVVLNPTFPVDAFERERGIQLATIEAQKDQLLQSAGRAMRRTLFGDQTYGLNAIGCEESVTKLNVDALKEFYRELVVPNNCVISIFGDVNTDAVKKAVEKAFEDWKRTALLFAAGAKSPAATISGGPKHVTETRDKKQAVLVMGFSGIDLYSDDRYPLELLQESCSDLGSRLFLRIREQLGLAYYVGAQHFMGLAPGYFAFYCGTAPGKTDLVEKEFLKEVELLRSEGLTETELKRSKAKVLGQKKIARQDVGHLATSAALDELYGLGFDFTDKEDAKVEAVTLEQVKAAAQKYLKPDAYVSAVVQPEAEK